MKYNTRSSDCDLIFLKEVKKSNTKVKTKGDKLDCDIIFCKKVQKTIKRKKHKLVNLVSRKEEMNKIKFYQQGSFFTNKINGLKQIKPCSVILEKINVKQLRSNFRAPKFYPLVKSEPNEITKPCSVYLERITVKQFLNHANITKPCSVLLKESDFKLNIKQEKIFSDTNQEIKQCNETLSSFINSLSHSIQQGPQSAITVKTESDLCLKQDKHKQFINSYSTGESEILLNEYFCAHCNKMLPSKKAIYYHVCNAKIKNGFLCEICFKNFDFYRLLIKHKSYHALSLSCSNAVRNRRVSSTNPLIKLSTMDQSLRESNELKCASSEKCHKLKENNPPKKRNRKTKIFIKNPACASTSSGYSSSKLEFLPNVWESDESSTE